MKSHRKIGVITALFLASLIGLTASISLENRVHPKIRRYVNGIFTEEMENQEEEFNIEYPGVPKLRIKKRDDNKTSGPNGTYTYAEDLITIYARSLKKFDPELARHTIRHELGHYFADKLNENLENENKVERRGRGEFSLRPNSLLDYVLKKLVSEGIAEYFASGPDEREGLDPNFLAENPEGLGIGSIDFYERGYRIVEPIISQYGEKGIEYLIMNPLEDSDWDDGFKSYQERALKSLEKSK